MLTTVLAIMKIVIGGSSGFVGTEIVRQALTNPAVTTVIALSRRETMIPTSCASKYAMKLKSVVCDDFENYPDSIKDELHDVDACIWQHRTIAVTPMKLKTLPWEEIVKVSRDYAVTAIETLANLPRKQGGQPLRFIYMSGHFAPRERGQQLKVLDNNGMVEYGFLRGEAENRILEYAEQSKGVVQACIAKSGFVNAPGLTAPNVPGLPTIELETIAAALLAQAMNGFEKDTLFSDDMTRIGGKALAEWRTV
ncbi:hypothetical protein N0V82_004818 [Gnomoniopsis sp. IMI 355080]|nr:hypothetical protein N0V82_004818 [Gnomoniopsis sp. IMI 355080]